MATTLQICFTLLLATQHIDACVRSSTSKFDRVTNDNRLADTYAKPVQNSYTYVKFISHFISLTSITDFFSKV